MINPIQWEDFSTGEQAALVKASESSILAFTSFWFNITQGDSFRPNWHHHYYKYAIDKMLNGEAQNIVINIPPGGNKTEFFSVHLTGYCVII